MKLENLHLGQEVNFYSCDNVGKRKLLTGKITHLSYHEKERDCDGKGYNIEVEVDERFNKERDWDGTYQLRIKEILRKA